MHESIRKKMMMILLVAGLLLMSLSAGFSMTQISKRIKFAENKLKEHDEDD